MTNDKELVKQMKKLSEEVKELSDSITLWNNNVEFLGNQCASTDRQMERVIDVFANKVSKTGKKIMRLYDVNFK